MNTIKDKLKEMKQNLREKGKRPIFFIGSGLSKRYLNTPSWKELLEEIAKKANCDYKEIEKICNGEYEKIAQELEYYCFRNAADETCEGNRKSHRDILRDYVAMILNKYKEEYKAKITSGENNTFNKEINNQLDKIGNLSSHDKIVEIQNCATEYDGIAKKVKNYSDDLKNLREIIELRKISPKAIITTNYDTLLEDIIFENRCHRRIGQESFSDCYSEDYDLSNSESKIDLYKIHGCVTKPDSIIITKEDYDNFFQKSKYLYSKILTLFWEYPVIFIGYSISDRNIRDILTVMIEIMTEEQKEKFLKNIWIVDFVEHEEDECGTDKEIELSKGRKIKVPCFRLTYYLKLYEEINEVVLSQSFGDLNFTISENVIELLIEPLYQQQNKLKVVVRELLQNALDACKKKKVNAEINIKVFENESENWLEIKDNGIGMDLQEIKDNLLTVGKTSKEGSCEGLVGKYGIGILSVFLIGEYAEIYTKKEGNVLLAFKIYIQSGKKQVNWLRGADNFLEKDRSSYTVVKIRLKGGLEIKNKENYMELLGLESYITKEENSIIVNYMDKQCEVPKIINLPEWLKKLSDEVKIYKLEYSTKDEEKLEDAEKKLKKIMDRKGIILYNDMISCVEYVKTEYRQLNNIDIPFIILDMKRMDKAEKDIKTNLSRSTLQISGDVMKSIAKGVYQLELEKIMEVIENSQKESDKEGCNMYAMLKNIKNSSDIIRRNVDILIYNGELYVSKINIWDHFRICGKEEKAKKFIEGFSEPVLFCEERMDRSHVSDLIENDSLVCISENYLQTYLLNATSQHNGLRKQAVIKLLNLLEGINIDETWWVKQIWDFIKENRKQLIEKFYAKMSQGILWLKKEHIRDDIEAKGEYFMIFKSRCVEQFLDNEFCEILQNALKEKSYEHIINIHKG